jgi:FecR protein
MKYKEAAPTKLVCILVTTFCLTAFAAAQWPAPPPRQPAPQRGARLQYISGEVSIAPRETNQWTAARLYQTIGPSQYIWTGKDSRAELSVGYGVFRMSSEASVTLLALNRSTVQIGVNQGEVTLTIVHLFPGEIYEIDTPNATLTATKSGVYRVDVHPNEDTSVVTVRKGSLTATGGSGAVTVKSDQQVFFRGGNSLQHTTQKAPPKDGFEDWASVRDQRMKAGRPPFVVGIGPYPYGAVAVPAPPPPPPPYYR